jgi:hypothetical protein
MTYLRSLSIVILAGLFLGGCRTAMTRPIESPVEYFHLGRVRLLDGPFKEAREADHRYLLTLDPDRLLAPFRATAGLEPKAPSYGSWENTGLDGHTAGHYLTALAQMAATGDDPEMNRRLNAMIAGLAECQKANGNGYVGGVPNPGPLWDGIAAGDIRAEPFNLNRAWVPWYNLHKLYAGLRDAWLIGGNRQARDILIGLSDWCLELTSQLSDEQMQRMLATEHGGMNEVFADLSVIAGDPRHLDLARRFSHREILDALAAGRDELTGKHANTQIPKVIGFQRIHELSGDPAMGAAARFFWDTVTAQRSVAIGGNSVDEHFNPPDDFAKMIEHRTGVETCNSYNMLRLTELLFRESPSARYADFYERALYNHILSSQHPGKGGFVYFTSMHPGHYRVYSQPGQAFWCCVGSGMENHGKYGAFIYAHAADNLLVNLFIASELSWPEEGLTLRQETTFPDQPGTSLRLALDAPRVLTIRLRRPAWVESDGFRVLVNGRRQTPATSDLPGYVALTRQWRDGDRIDVELPMRVTLERLPGGSPWAAVLVGPIVMASPTGRDGLDGLFADDGRWAHIANGPLPPVTEAPILAADPDRLSELLKPVPGQAMTFSAPGAIRPERYADLRLIPFFRLHDARYVVYWSLPEP